MLLNNLLEPSVIQLCKLGQIVYIGNNIAQIFFQELKVLLGWRLDMSSLGLVGLGRPRDDVLDLLFRCLYPANNVVTPDMLESEDLVQLLLKLSNKACFVILGPCLPGWVWVA